MSWVASTGFTRRPLVVAEDHLHHVTELLNVLAEADASILPLTTVVCLDRAGPDTARLLAQWLAMYPALQVAASIGPGDEASGLSRFAALDAAVFENANRFCKAVAGMLRPGGLLLQDIQLSTLKFIPPDRWWESIYVASTVRGMFAENPPICRFLSNKRGYEATFGRDLIDAGFNPRDVMDKSELRTMVAPVVRSYLERSFPFRLRIVHGPSDAAVAKTEEDQREIEGELDLVVWCAGPAVEIGGRLLPGEGERRRLAFKPGSQEAVTWIELVDDRIRGGEGVAVVDVGKRIAPEGAGRAEITNLAARHIHGLRGRLRDGTAILTAHHAYRLAAGLRVGRVTARSQPAET
ncbi:MAG TPA: hypothetical protein VGX68_01210 [Thermoanaerobaculia bacterium]|jgi:hypothetical protein|nr:hypothetical protein [Thermoanaerobaculia bacterium]